jgi:hypothetical protein
VKTHFLLVGIPVETLNQCIHRSLGFRLQVAGNLWDVRCHLVEIYTSVALEISAAPLQSRVSSPVNDVPARPQEASAAQQSETATVRRDDAATVQQKNPARLKEVNR